MEANRILIVAKESKVEYEQRKLGISVGQLKAKYASEHANLPAILESHEGQVAARQKLRELLPDARMIMMNELEGPVEGHDIVISFGGDNSFTYASHYANGALLMGVNSDPKRSVGALCKWSSSDLESVVSRLRTGEFRTEEWTRLEAVIDGKPVMPATSEYFFGEKQRNDMSRHVLVYRGREEEQKSSGIIIATGAGSTGWYLSSSSDTEQFPATEQKAKFNVTERYRHVQNDGINSGEILPGEELVLYSLNDRQGIANADAWDEFDFSRGRKAVVRISDKPLRVIVPQLYLLP